MAKEKFETSVESGWHQKLSLMSGRWSGTTRVWFEEGKPPVDEAATEASIRTVLEGRFLLYESKGSFQGKSISGIALIGCALGSQEFQIAWVDSFHTGTSILFSSGNMASGHFSVLGSYGLPDIDPPWGWRTEIELKDENTLVITMFNISPDGISAKAVESIYHRKFETAL